MFAIFVLAIGLVLFLPFLVYQTLFQIQTSNMEAMSIAIAMQQHNAGMRAVCTDPAHTPPCVDGDSASSGSYFGNYLPSAIENSSLFTSGTIISYYVQGSATHKYYVVTILAPAAAANIERRTRLGEISKSLVEIDGANGLQGELGFYSSSAPGCVVGSQVQASTSTLLQDCLSLKTKPPLSTPLADGTPLIIMGS